MQLSCKEKVSSHGRARCRNTLYRPFRAYRLARIYLRVAMSSVKRALLNTFKFINVVLWWLHTKTSRADAQYALDLWIHRRIILITITWFHISLVLPFLSPNINENSIMWPPSLTHIVSLWIICLLLLVFFSRTWKLVPRCRIQVRPF